MSDYNIKLYWIRHGYSCANLVRDAIGYTDLFHDGTLFPHSKYAPDAQLTNYGIKYIMEVREQNKELINNIDIVLTSELRRAIETALILFKDKKIYPVPYVNENRIGILEFFDVDQDNNIMGLSELEKYLKLNYGKDTDRIDYSLLNELKKGSTEILSANIDNFYKIVIPALIKKQLNNKQLNNKQLNNKQLNNKQLNNKQLNNKQLNNKQLNNKQLNNKQLNIGIVSHQKFIKTHLNNITNSKLPYINNADIYVEDITVKLINNELVDIKHNKILECNGQYNGITCKISKNLPILDKINNDKLFLTCNNNLKERLKDIKSIYLKQKGGNNDKNYHYKYLKYKIKYMNLLFS